MKYWIAILKEEDVGAGLEISNEAYEKVIIILNLMREVAVSGNSIFL